VSTAYFPSDFREAPILDEATTTGCVTPRAALLVNPFYPKDPHASFGKHVLTPTLALTSIAASTPAGWDVRYWDENLLQGPPPIDPMPEVVGITVHLTFAERAYALARYYRARGAKVILGGLHVLSCPDEARPHADAIALGEGVEVWPEILEDVARGALRGEYRGDYRKSYRALPAPRRNILPRDSFLTTASLIATRGCHNRCGFCYLSTEGLSMPYRMRGVEQVVDELVATGEPYAVFIDNNLGSRPDYLRALCRALRPSKDLERGRHHRRHGRSVSRTGDGARGLHGGVHRFRVAHGRQPHRRAQEDAARERLRAACADPARQRHPGERQLRARIRPRWAVHVRRHGRLDRGAAARMRDLPRPDTVSRDSPLRQMESEGRLLHKDYRLYDTAHVVFRPKRLTVEALEEGYASCYERLFSHGSIWRRRPSDPRAVPAYLGMSYLYKRANRFWHFLIRERLVHSVWAPLVEATRLRHLRFRRELERRPVPGGEPLHGQRRSLPVLRRSASVVSAGV